MSDKWERCPRCSSPQTQIIPAINPLNKWLSVGIAIAGVPSFLILGILIPCLWIGVPISIVLVMAFTQARTEETGHCKICEYEWEINE